MHSAQITQPSEKKFEPVSTQSLWIVKLYFTSDNTLSFGPWEVLVSMLSGKMKPKMKK